MLETRNKFINRKTVLYIGLFYTAFAGMFNFPLMLDGVSEIVTNIFMFYILSISLFAYFNKKSIKLFFSVFGLSVIGMIGRFFLEYGEVSNKRNFTPINIIAYLVVVPITVTLISFLLNKIADNK